MDKKTMDKKTKKKVKVKGASDSQSKAKVQDKVNSLDGVDEVIFIDEDVLEILYDEALLEEALLLAAIEELGYDTIVIAEY